jgi:hypothetical protein
MAPRGIGKMAGHELRRIFLVPFKCPHCRTENDGAAGWVIEHGKLRCQNTVCGRDIDLSGADWLAFRKGLDEAWRACSRSTTKCLIEVLPHLV